MEPKKLGRATDQRIAILKNQVSELLWYGKIETTVDRAKSVKAAAEKIITLAINTYEDTVKITKNKTNLKGEKVDVEFANDGPKKLAARRTIIAELRDIPETKLEKETKTAYKARTGDVKNALVEKVFNDLAPKYAGRSDDKGQKGGYARIIRTGFRRGDAAEMCILELL